MTGHKTAAEETLFGWACMGDIASLEKHAADKECLNAVFKKFGTEHSLIMGAYRNRQWDTVRWLLEHGAKLTRPEQDEVNSRYMEIVLLSEMQDIIK